MRSGYDLIPSQAEYQTHVITLEASRVKDLDVTRPPQHYCFIMKMSGVPLSKLAEGRFFKGDHKNVVWPAL